jgi:hypothetical protein
LSETPPAPDLAGLVELYQVVRDHNGKVQIAEQYHLRPHHQVQIYLANSGKIGDPTYCSVRVAHGYHGISLLRKFLNVGIQNCEISARKFESIIATGPDRDGLPKNSTTELKKSEQNIYQFDFGGKLGQMNFSPDQYFGLIRTEQVLIYGDRGEITNQKIRYLKDAHTPIELDFKRHEYGMESDINGRYLDGIQVGEEMMYRNPFASQPLMDEEIAVGHTLQKMEEYVTGGKSFYPLSEGCQDHYLYLMGLKAMETREPVTVEEQIWSN